jgi:hypothetical protein
MIGQSLCNFCQHESTDYVSASGLALLLSTVHDLDNSLDEHVKIIVIGCERLRKSEAKILKLLPKNREVISKAIWQGLEETRALDLDMSRGTLPLEDVRRKLFGELHTFMSFVSGMIHKLFLGLATSRPRPVPSKPTTEVDLETRS